MLNRHALTTVQPQAMQTLDLQMSNSRRLGRRTSSVTCSNFDNEAVPGNTIEVKGPSRQKMTDKEDSMQVVMRTYLMLGQCFGLIPVRGIYSLDPNDLKFTWTSKRAIYAMLVLTIKVILLILQIISCATLHGLTYTTVEKLISDVISAVQMAIFINQARSWPRLMVEWSKVERQMKSFKPFTKIYSTIRCFVYSFAIGTLFLGLSRFVGPMAHLMQCSEDWFVLLQLLIVSKYYSLFSVFGFSLTKAAGVIVMFLYSCVLMIYDELTLTVLAYCLYLRFRQIHLHLLKNKHQIKPISYWAEMRETYNRLSHLTKLLDNHLSWMTLVCFSINLYHICSLLLKTISPEIHLLAYRSLLYELLFVLSRTFVAALMASSIYEESKKPLSLLFFVPSDTYNGEVSRFHLQVSHDELAITGCNFFSITRSFMLTVAGTIATYEIVLLQFGSSNENNETAQNITSEMCSRLMHFVKH